MYNVLMLFFYKNPGKKRIFRALTIIITMIMSFFYICTPLAVYADDPKTDEEYQAEAEERKELTVESNEVIGWPTGPTIGAEAAILMDAETGQILYAKNIDERLMPASTTKIMTCLTAVRHGVDLNELITVSQAAIDANDADGSNMGLYAGEQLTVEEIMTGILVTSANEGCNALAEHIAGSMDGYVDMMNEEAMNLGLQNTHFVTTNGLPDPDHYTTARDLATIAREFFSYDLLCRLSSTPYVEMPETDLHKAHDLYSKNKLYKNRDYEYPYLVGSKTGYTDAARQTLVSCAEKDGVKLICVILMEEAPYQFEDTVNLFDYGFNNFAYTSTSEFRNDYVVGQADYFNDVSDGCNPLINIMEESKILLPIGADFQNITTDISYDNPASGSFATVNYYYNGYLIGKTGLQFTPNTFTRESIKLADSLGSDVTPVVINIKTIIIRLFIAIAVVFVLIIIGTFVKRLIRKYKENKHRTQKFSNTRRINKNSDRQRKLGRKREQKDFKLKRKTLEKETREKRNISKRYKKNRH